MFNCHAGKQALDNGQKAGALLSDLSKAFDCLDHNLLIAKGNAYGCEYNSVKHIYSYLQNRFHRVKVNSTYSSWAVILSGVPKGSILVTLIFNICLIDLFLFYEEPVTTQPRETLSVNGENYKIYNRGVEKLELLIVNYHLTNMLVYCAKKASQRLHALSRIAHYMDTTKRKTIMNAFINKQFGYCALVWMCHSKKISNKINNMQKRGIVYTNANKSINPSICDCAFE